MRNRGPSSVIVAMFLGLTLFPMAGETLFGQWVVQNSTMSMNLYGVSFVDSATGWVVGDSGIVLHTTDGGHQWSRQQSNAVHRLLSVSFCDSQDGWAVGTGGTILRTSDGGANWEHVDHDTSFNVRHFKVQCLNPTSVVILRDSFEVDFHTNYRLWRTDNAGSSWADISPRESFYAAIRDVHFVSLSHGWTCGFGGAVHGYQIHRTTDGGVTWLTENFNIPTYWAIQRIYFESGLEGWATDWDTLYHSEDGGVTWEKDRVARFGELTDLIMMGEMGYASRVFGKILKTTDKGVSWFEQPSSPEGFIEDLEFISPEIGWAVGWNGQIVHTIDGGLGNVEGGDLDPTMSRRFVIHTPYPNPFNPTTTIEFSTPQSGWATLTVYDLLGREVNTLVDSRHEAGRHQVQWDASDVASGIYFVKMQSGSFSQMRKITVLK